MVGIITAIKTKEECDCCFAPMARATCTTIVITNAWIAMVTSVDIEALKAAGLGKAL